jgi:hypothetical protein
MYKIKCLENRVKVFKDGVEYIEMDVVTTCKNFLADHQELLDALETLTEDTLEKILSCYNADFKGKQYRLNKVGELVKNDKGQLSLW